MSKNTNKPKERLYTRWQLAKGSSLSTVHKGFDEDENRCVWVGEDEYLRLKDDYDAATKATFDAIRTITQLRDENERLRKAGDELIEDYLETGIIFQITVDDWNAAKEGRDAK